MTALEPTARVDSLETLNALGRRSRVQRRVLGFLLFFVAIGALPPEALYWDGIGFLQRATAGGADLDYGHALYVPLLEVWHRGLNLVWYATWEFSAKLFSSLGAATFFVLLWIRIERRGLDPVPSFALALVGATTPLFWRQAGIVEPTTWTLAMLLVAAAAAEHYGERPTVARAAGFALSVALLLGLHVVSVFALPWLVWRTRHRESGFPPLMHAGLFALFAGAAVLLLDATNKLGEAWSFVGYWAGFLPAFELETGRANAGVAWQVLTVGMPGALVAGAIGVALSAGIGRRCSDAWILGVPYLVAFLVVGQPVAGLMIPLGVVLTLCAADGARELVAREYARLDFALVRVLLPLLIVLQTGQGMATALKRARTPDDLQQQAELLAAALPKSSVMLAGTVAHHVHWVTNAPVVALPNELHGVASGGVVSVDADGIPLAPRATGDVLEALRSIAAREAQSYEAVYLSSDAIDWLEWRFGVSPTTLPVDRAGSILVSQAPLLYLVPMLLPTPVEPAAEPATTDERPD